MSHFGRRDLFRWMGAGLMGLIALACQREASPPEQGTPGPTSTSESGQGPLATVTRAVTKILRNMNRSHYNVRFFRSFEALEHDAWRLSIEGIVSGPSELTYEEMMAMLPAREQNSRMVCVEGWSFRADWTGFTLPDLLGIVVPEAEARFLHFECADGYYEAMSLEDLSEARVLFAYQMDGQELSDEHGWPLRLIVPPRYGYKGSKSITKLRFARDSSPGYWPTVGPYTVHGLIQVRRDFPQDLPGESFQTKEGVEQTY